MLSWSGSMTGMRIWFRRRRSCRGSKGRHLWLALSPSILLAMKSIGTERFVDEAVEFLSARVAEEARKESAPLTDIELKQLSFTEETATPGEIAAAGEFDETHDTNKFEGTVAR